MTARAVAALLTLGAAFAAPAPAAANGGWTLLGQMTLSERSDRQVIALPGNRRYARLRVCALRRAVRLRDVEVVFGDNARQRIRFGETLDAGACSREAMLDGREPRRVRRIVLRYAEGAAQPPYPVVQVFGQ